MPATSVRRSDATEDVRLPETLKRNAELIRQVALENPKTPRALRRSIPHDLETIVLKAIEKDPDSRYASLLAAEERVWRDFEEGAAWRRWRVADGALLERPTGFPTAYESNRDVES